MALLEELGAYLDSEIVTLTAGTNLFYGRLPDDPDTAVALVEYGGEQPTSVMGSGTLPPVESPRVQVICRAAGYSSARSLAISVWAALEAVVNENLSGVRFHRVAALQSAFPLERDARDRVVFVQNFEVSKAT